MPTQIPEGAKIYLISISVSVGSREFCQVVFSPNKAAYTNITGCVTGGENCMPSLPTYSWLLCFLQSPFQKQQKEKLQTRKQPLQSRERKCLWWDLAEKLKDKKWNVPAESQLFLLGCEDYNTCLRGLFWEWTKINDMVQWVTVFLAKPGWPEFSPQDTQVEIGNWLLQFVLWFSHALQYINKIH